MNKENLNISKIETFFYGIIDNIVSNNTYVGSLPDTIDSDWDDMVLIDMGSNILDRTGYGQGVVNIFLYAKPRGDGSKNVALLSALEKKLDEVISKAKDDRYITNVAYRNEGFDSDRKWHYNIVALNLNIF